MLTDRGYTHDHRLHNTIQRRAIDPPHPGENCDHSIYTQNLQSSDKIRFPIPNWDLGKTSTNCHMIIFVRLWIRIKYTSSRKLRPKCIVFISTSLQNTTLPADPPSRTAWLESWVSHSPLSKPKQTPGPWPLGTLFLLLPLSPPLSISLHLAFLPGLSAINKPSWQLPPFLRMI